MEDRVICEEHNPFGATLSYKGFSKRFTEEQVIRHLHDFSQDDLKGIMNKHRHPWILDKLNLQLHGLDYTIYDNEHKRMFEPCFGDVVYRSYDYGGDYRKFVKKLLECQEHLINDIILFMSVSGLHFNDDGDIVAYKVVKSSWDDHVIGATISVDHNSISDDKDTRTGLGLYVYDKNSIKKVYKKGDRIVEITFKPTDIVVATIRGLMQPTAKLSCYRVTKDVTEEMK